MNLHETLTNSRSIAHAVPIALREQQGDARGLPAGKLMARHRHHSLLIGIAVLFGLMLAPAGASAATATCDYRDLLDAAANGRAITQHTPACYQQALSELPGDVDEYFPAVRANVIKAMHRDATLTAVKSGTSDAVNARTTQSAAGDVVAAGVRGPVTDLLQGLGPAHVDEVPAPVVALGGASALLLLAGLGTSLARVRSRRRVAR
jgi:hypothetical protein